MANLGKELCDIKCGDKERVCAAVGGWASASNSEYLKTTAMPNIKKMFWNQENLSYVTPVTQNIAEMRNLKHEIMLCQTRGSRVPNLKKTGIGGDKTGKSNDKKTTSKDKTGTYQGQSSLPYFSLFCPCLSHFCSLLALVPRGIIGLMPLSSNIITNKTNATLSIQVWMYIIKGMAYLTNWIPTSFKSHY